MQNWLRRQNSFTRWAAIATATSVAIGMTAVAILIVTGFIVIFVATQQGHHGIAYSLVLNGITMATLCLIGISIVGFFVSAVGLIASLISDNKTRQGQAEE